MVKISELNESVSEFYGPKKKYYVVHDPKNSSDSVGVFISLGNSTKFSTMEHLIKSLSTKGYSGKVVEIVSYYDQMKDKQISFVSSEDPSQYPVDLTDRLSLSTESEAMEFMKKLKSDLMNSESPEMSKSYSIRITRLSSLLGEFDQGKYSWDTNYIGLSSDDSGVVKMFVMSKFSNYSYKEISLPDGRLVTASLKIGILINDN